MKNKFKNSKQGFVIGIALLGFLTLSFILITAMTSSTTSLKVSGDYARMVGTFSIAEVGLVKARPMLEGQDFSPLLSSYQSTPLIASTAFNSGTYEVLLRDNDDGDSDLAVDADNIVVITSIGRNATGGKVEIETYVQKLDGTNPIELPADPTTGPTASLMCGTSTANITVDGSNAIFSGVNMHVPDLATCTGSCDGSEVLPKAGGYGMTSETAVSLDWFDADSVQGYVSGADVNGTSAMSDGIGSDTKCSDWLNLNNQIASLSCSAPGVVCFTGASGTFDTSNNNDCTNPKIFMINSTEDSFKINGSARICGMVVVASDTSIELAGNAAIVGLVFVMGSDAQFKVDVTGTARVYGQVIANNLTAAVDKEIWLRGNSKIYYSSEGKNFAKQALSSAGVSGGHDSGTLLTVAWKESY